MREKNIAVFQDTLKIFDQGFYIKNGRKVKTKLGKAEIAENRVYLPEDIRLIEKYADFDHVHCIGRCGVGCENADSFSLAADRYEQCSYMFDNEDALPILVLNLANPVHPGGGVRKGAKAQEEDLCRRSSLLMSLEHESASQYYKYNKSLNTKMGSDAVIITPNVEVVKEADGSLLDESVIVSVMTCAAPMIKHGMEGLSQKEYEQLIYERITVMLKVAAYEGYKVLVLGAFGCGAFGNDAKLVSDLFYKAMKAFDFDGMSLKDFFGRIDFAVLDNTKDKYNYNEFMRNFGNFYREEDLAEINSVNEEKLHREKYLNQIRGCMVGGAAGDALGYAVEFEMESEIFSRYGDLGITEYELDRASGKALISDDTQMTLFTANGILVGETRVCTRGIGGAPRMYMLRAYQDWLKTQDNTYAGSERISWLLDVPELHSRRAPGNTCLSALYAADSKEYCESYVEKRVNNSKGCGAVMRVAPLGIHYEGLPVEGLMEEAAEISAMTHGHELGYMPSAALTYILNQIVYSEGKSLHEIVADAIRKIRVMYAEAKHVNDLCSILEKALMLAENRENDIDNIHELGEGWVAEEALAIAVYCALRHSDDFSKCIIAAVNHNGDSDSTGAIAGNIIGAYLGYEAIDKKWTENLELIDVILEMSDDLCHGCQLAEFSSYSDPVWESKYINMMRPGSEATQCDTEVHVEKSDITKAEVDAIVNPANTNLTVGSGLRKAIYMAAGPEYLDSCVKLGKCKVSEALITKGYNLPCKYVIHTVGPSWKDGNSGEKQLLRKTYENIMKLAEKNGIRSIALPSISTGRKGYPVNEAARVAVSTVINFVEGHPDAFDEIVWIVGSDRDKEAYENQIGLAVVSKLVSSSSLNAINDILRNGKLM